MNLQFDAATHTYTLDGRKVPSVTRILDDVVPGWHADEWYMARGSACHAAYAMLARGVPVDDIEMDDECRGQALQWMLWRNTVRPEFKNIELPVASVRYQYAGTLDFAANMYVNDDLYIGDYKASWSLPAEWQVAAYAIAADEMGIKTKGGLIVEIKADGWKVKEVKNMKRRTNEWLAILTAYRCRREAGIKEGTR